MKKLLFISISTLLSLSIFAATPTYELKSEKMDIGKLAQGDEKEAVGTFIVKRTAKSPSKVELTFAFSEYYSYCSESAVESYWVPSEWSYSCHSHKDKNGDTIEICNNTLIPGHYAHRAVCVAYDYAASPESESLKLDFKKASKLAAGESETFVVTLKQKSIVSEGFDVSIKPKTAKQNYEITRKKVLFWNTFGFKFKAL